MKKLMVLSAAAVCGLAVHAKTVTVDNVVALTNELARTGDPNLVVCVEPGDYDLRGIQMSTANGGSHLKLLYSKLKGLGAKPEDVRFIGDGTLRVLDVDSNWYGADPVNGARVDNICVTNGYAQGDSGVGGGIRGNGVVSNCVVVGCRATKNGGGIGGSGLAQNSVIRGCMAQNGGGVASVALYDSVVQDNYCTGFGGGLYSLKAERCTIKNNFSGNSTDGYGLNSDNAAFCNLKFCDISGTTVFAGSGFGCTVHDIGQSVTLTGNPFVTDEVTRENKSAWVGGPQGWPAIWHYPAVTNCLFYNNQVAYQHYSASLFSAHVKSIVNCTIVSNRYVRPFGQATDTANPIVVENTVFAGNRYAYYNSYADLCDHSWAPTCAAGAILFKNCAYEKANSSPFTDKADFKHPDGEVYQFGVDGFPSNPGFSGKGEHPYLLRKGSPLRRLGEVQDWMADSFDCRGEGFPRLDFGKVDIGCYQTYSSGLGLGIFVR